jgi:hypothetical protein
VKRLVAFAVIGLILVVAAQAQDRPLVLVFDLKTTHLSKDEMVVLIDYIASNLLNSGQYRVIDRRQREQALSEISFSNSGLSDEELRLKVGKFLSANYMLDGSIGVIGDRFLLNLKLVDVNTAETLKTASQRYPNINDLIDDAARLTMNMVGGTAARPPGVAATRPPAAPPAAPPVAPPPARPATPPAAAAAGAETLGSLSFAADGTVTDRRTGLTWARERREDVTYAEAEAYVRGLRLGGASDWRIPTEDEMMSLAQTIVQMTGQPYLSRVIELLGWNSTAAGKSDSYWTQTAWRRDPGRVMAVDMAILLMGNNSIRGGVGRAGVQQKDTRQDVRAVR